MEKGTKDILRMAGFGKQVELIEQGKCPLCGKDMKDPSFRDELSRTEYGISGLCQQCQDKAFS